MKKKKIFADSAGLSENWGNRSNVHIFCHLLSSGTRARTTATRPSNRRFLRYLFFSFMFLAATRLAFSIISVLVLFLFLFHSISSLSFLSSYFFFSSLSFSFCCCSCCCSPFSFSPPPLPLAHFAHCSAHIPLIHSADQFILSFALSVLLFHSHFIPCYTTTLINNSNGRQRQEASPSKD
jgi:hypothetical protein